MASPHKHTFVAGETIWHIAGRYQADAGATDLSSFVDAIRAANSTILDWLAVPTQDANGNPTVITIPYSTS